MSMEGFVISNKLDGIIKLSSLINYTVNETQLVIMISGLSI